VSPDAEHIVLFEPRENAIGVFLEQLEAAIQVIAESVTLIGARRTSALRALGALHAVRVCDAHGLLRTRHVCAGRGARHVACHGT
jgi:hypothetical protein